MYEELIAVATRYAAIRAGWQQLSREEKMDRDSSRTFCHNSVITHAPNPEDNLRDLMGAEEYADLMEETDAALFNLTADYAPSDFSGDPYAISENETDIADSISDNSVDDGGIDEDCDGVDGGMDI